MHTCRQTSRSVTHLMHIKCIHELCTELLIFQSYLHHIRVISLFSIDFRNISQFSYFSGVNPALAENPIFYIFEFQGPKRRPNDLKIYGHQFLEGRRRMSEGGEEVEARGPKHLGPRSQIRWPRGTHCFGPCGSVTVNLSSRSFVLT